MNIHYLTVSRLNESKDSIRAGDKVFLSGEIYTARDAAHLRLCKLMEEHKELPFEIKNSVIYYAGPTPTKDNGQIGSFGPTTSSRMDAFTPVLLDAGMIAMIGKGDRNEKVIEAIKRNKALYFCAGGGLGALISKCITSSEVIAFPELGCESIKKITIDNMPLIAAIDTEGNSVFDRK